MPTVIAAARLHAHGEPLAAEQVSLPDPGPGELRVDLRYGGVNPVDTYVAAGRVATDGPLPRTLGGEAAGTVEGRPVLVAGEGLGSARDGVWATAANVPAEAVLEIPDGVGLQAAAAMGIAGLTALNCVRHLARVTAADRVLVLGASGGVGSMIVGLAAAAGATVWGQTGSPAKVPRIAAHGAEHVIVGDAAALAGPLAQFAPTVALDPLGGAFIAPVIAAMPPRGRYVSYGVSAGAQVAFNIQLLYRKMITLYGYGGMQLTREQRRPGLEEALRALAAGELAVSVDTVLALDGVNEAFARLARRDVQGKLLLDLS